MKKIFTIVCSAAILNLGLSAKGQTQDTVLARNDAIKKTRLKEKTGNKVATPSISMQKSSSHEVEETGITIKSFKNLKRPTMNNKVGPNGEEAFMKRRKYYYLDEQGEKVKIKSSQLKDKPKHS